MSGALTKTVFGNGLKGVAVAFLVLGLLSVTTGDASADDGASARPLTVDSVRASSHDGNVPQNTLDGDLSTRWSASGDGSWIEYDLGSAETVGSVAVAFYKGDQRTANFDVQVSEDKSSYTTALSGATSSGASVGLQNFDFAGRQARYVRIVGFGNSRNNWNSITEVEVYGGEQEVVDPDYGKLARDYADAMVKGGRDRYGDTNSPLFATMLDRETMRLIPNVKETIPMTREEHGVRESDRSWNAANLDDDHALHTLLYELGQRNPSYADAADDSLRWYATNTQHPTTKMIPWGEHVGWRLDTEGPTRHESGWSDRKHELQLDMTGIWPDAFRLAPGAMEDYSRSLWEYHVYDKQNGLHAHQTRYDKYDPDKGWLFPRMAGHMVSVWTHAYASSDDPEFRADALTWIEKIATTHNARRNPQSDATTQYWGPETEGEIGAEVGHSAFNDLQGVIDVHRALNLGVLPEDVASELRDWTRRSDRTFLAVDHPFASGGEGYVNRVELATLEPLAPPGTPEPWCSSYGRVSPAVEQALYILERYHQTGEERYLDLARTGADWYASREPECDYVVDGARGPLPLWPGPVADAIELFLGMYEVTGDERYLDEADRLGRFAADTFLDDTSPLPRVFAPGHRSDYDHYEGHTGGPDLMLALYKLDGALGR